MTVSRRLCWSGRSIYLAASVVVSAQIAPRFRSSFYPRLSLDLKKLELRC
jgi:hypothetical protein